MSTTGNTPDSRTVDNLMSDWLGNLREKDTFIHKDITGAMEHVRLQGESVSEYVLGSLRGRDPLDVLKQSREIAQNIIGGMTPKKVTVRIGGSSSYTDGTAIQIATDHFDSSELSLGDKLDIFIGYAVHETCHVLHTDFELGRQFVQHSEKYLQALKKDIANILEDERIELLLGESIEKGGDGMPGMTDYIAAAKRHIFSIFNNEGENRLQEPEEPLPRFLNTLLLAVRYPASLTRERVTEHLKEMSAIRDILTPYPETQRQVQDATDRIVEVMKDIIRDQMQQQQNRQNRNNRQEQQKEESDPQNNPENDGDNSNTESRSDEQKSDDRDKEQNSRSGSDGQPEKSEPTGKQEETDKGDAGQGQDNRENSGNNDGKGGSRSDRETEEKKDTPDYTGKGSGADGKGDSKETDGGPSEKEVEKEFEKALTSKEMKELMDAIENSMNGSTSSGNHDASALSDRNSTDYANGEAEMDCSSSGFNNRFFIRKAKGDKDRYEQSLSRVKRLVPATAKALRCSTQDFDYELNGMKSGRLQTSKLVSLKLGNTNVFSKRGTVEMDSACICILIDESGSMTSERIEGSRDAAVLISEAVRHIANLELFIYGFTTNLGTGTIKVYKENGRCDRHALGTTSSTGGTPTADAMELTARRIRKLTRTPCLMIILTDGMPDNKQRTIEQNEALSRKDFVTVGIDIAGENKIKTVFKDAISTRDMPALAPLLGQLVRKKLKRMMRKHDSL